jgi:hypothetical protein
VTHLAKFTVLIMKVLIMKVLIMKSTSQRSSKGSWRQRRSALHR